MTDTRPTDTRPTDTHPTAARAGLAAVAGPDGTLAIVAMDQRNTLRRMLTAVGRPPTRASSARSRPTWSRR